MSVVRQVAICTAFTAVAMVLSGCGGSSCAFTIKKSTWFSGLQEISCTATGLDTNCCAIQENVMVQQWTTDMSAQQQWAKECKEQAKTMDLKCETKALAATPDTKAATLFMSNSQENAKHTSKSTKKVEDAKEHTSKSTKKVEDAKEHTSKSTEKVEDAKGSKTVGV